MQRREHVQMQAGTSKDTYTQRGNDIFQRN
jgi:hypothetical protein